MEKVMYRGKAGRKALLAWLAAGCLSAQGPGPVSMRMADGKDWTTHNLNVVTTSSWCYKNGEPNCRRYGRLYTWESATQACRTLGTGWRLPSDSDWRQLAKHYGGMNEDSSDAGKSAYNALLTRGGSGFNALLGGSRQPDGEYARLEAHGFYWTASENGSANAFFYNFGRGSAALYRQPEGSKQMAISVRCIRD